MSKFKLSMNVLLLILLAAIILAYYFYAFVPLSTAITKLDADHLVDTSIINMIKPYEKDDTALKNKRDQLLKTFNDNDISKKLISGATLASEIRNAAAASGVKVNEITVSDPTVSQKQAESNPAYYYSSAAFSVKFTSDYNSGKQFISFFENDQNASVVLSTVDISRNANAYDFTLKLVLNYFGK